LDEVISKLDQEIERCLIPFEDARRRLAAIPGVGDGAAATLIAEIGVDMARFPTCGHLISWAGLCPRNDESAGKRRSTRLRDGDTWLKTTLVQCAWAATRAKGTYLQAQFQRLRARRGAKKAVIAVAASILGAAYYMLQRTCAFHDLTAEHFAKSSAVLAQSLLRRLRSLGYDVMVTAEPAHASVSS